MNEWIHALILAFVQGFTEFLPISSSAHLILLPKLFQWVDQGLTFDIAVHVGTLIAVVAYFYRDVQSMCQDTLQFIKTQQATIHSKMALQIVIATVPVGIAGLVFHDFIGEHLRSTWIIATTTIFFGILLWLSDILSKKSQKSVTYAHAVIIGLAQMLALIPGTSRSGITLTAGLALGLNRQLAARFSFLMAIPVIALAMLLELKKILSMPGPHPWMSLAIGTTMSAACAFVCIHFFLKLLDRLGVVPFVIYRLILGFCLFLFFV